MGIDAPSSDLTAGIRARRRQLVLAGAVDPLKPGERMIHGRAAGSIDVDAVSQVERAHSRRATRTTVPMDYQDYTGTQPGSKELAAADADEPFEITGDEEPDDDDADADDDDVFDLGPDGPTSVEDLLDDDDLEIIRQDTEPTRDADEITLLLQEVISLQERYAADLKGIHERLDVLGLGIDGLTRGLIALGEHTGAAFERLENPIITLEQPPPFLPEPEYKKTPWWRTLRDL